MLIGITKSLSDKLGDANYYILRTLFGLPKSTSYDSVFRLINTRTLEEWRLFHVLTLLFTSFNGNDPSYFKDFFKLRTVNYYLSNLETQTLSLSKIFLIARSALYYFLCIHSQPPLEYFTVQYLLLCPAHGCL